MQHEYKIGRATYVVTRAFVGKRSIFEIVREKMFTYILSKPVKNKLTVTAGIDIIDSVSGLPVEDE